MSVQRSPPAPKPLAHGADPEVSGEGQNMSPGRYALPGIKLKSPPVMLCQSDSALNKLTDDDMANVSKRHKRTFSEYTGIPDHYMLEIKNMFAELKVAQEQKFDSLNSSINGLAIQNNEIEKSVKSFSIQFEDVLNRVNCLEQENCIYKKRVKTLEDKLETLERNARNSSIEIRNIPVQANENKKSLIDIIKNIGAALNLETPIYDLEVKDIYRTKSEAIVTDFTNTIRRDAIVAAYREFNKSSRIKNEPQLNTNHVKLPGAPQAVFISDSLTNKARLLYYIARSLVKNKKLAATWASFGKVYVKVEEGQVPLRIEDEAEFARLTL